MGPIVALMLAGYRLGPGHAHMVAVEWYVRHRRQRPSSSPDCLGVQIPASCKVSTDIANSHGQGHARAS
jgi:hypothetical protein